MKQGTYLVTIQPDSQYPPEVRSRHRTLKAALHEAAELLDSLASVYNAQGYTAWGHKVKIYQQSPYGMDGPCLVFMQLHERERDYGVE